jgi:hypothetical protein
LATAAKITFRASTEPRIMTTFDKREEAFEKKFALDEELKFKAVARRDKLLGLWIAERLGISGDAARAYAQTVVAADFEAAGKTDLMHKVIQDLEAKGIAITEQQIREKLEEFLAQAVAQLKSGM